MRRWFFIVLFLSTSYLWAEDSIRFIREIPIQIKGQFCVDKMGNIYHYYKNELQKFDSLGTLKNKYSNNALGTISFVDVTNPLKLLVFYRDNSSILFLDNTLSEQGAALSLQDVHVEFVPHACVSQNEGFWTYDPQIFELKRFDEKLKLLFSSGNLYQITKTMVNPDFFIERHNKMLVQDSTIGFFVFDVNGNFIQKITCPSCSIIDYSEPFLWYHQNGHIIAYNMLTFEKSEVFTLVTKLYCVVQGFLYQYQPNVKSIGVYRAH